MAIQSKRNLVLVVSTLAVFGCGPQKVANSRPEQSSLSSASSFVEDSVIEKPLALIYKGPGSCRTEDGDVGESGFGCSEASADVATAAGFRYQYVGPKDSPDFSKARVWIQPGGHSYQAYAAMAPKLRTGVISFVKNGGGFVGFCAGAFLAAEWLGIFPGSASLYGYSPARSDVGYNFLSTTWNGAKRSVYFEGGPYLYNLGSTVEVTAKFSTGYVAAARAPYGKGRVYIAGPHPEAPAIWAEEDGLKDPDGSDIDLAAEMVTWAGNAQ
jgi:hypothetical protein